MKLLFDLFPVILFFATYKFASHGGQGGGACLSGADMAALPLWQEPILLATVVAIIATFGQVGWLLMRRQKVDTMLWISLCIIVVFGGATLYFRNPAFNKSLTLFCCVIFRIFRQITVTACFSNRSNYTGALDAFQSLQFGFEHLGTDHGQGDFDHGVILQQQLVQLL